jgi:hypothetical protein
LESYIIPFLARFLPFEAEIREEMDKGVEGDQGVLLVALAINPR